MTLTCAIIDDEPLAISLLESYVDTAKAIAAGLRLDCGLDSPQVVLHQYSSDDQVILTAASDGTVETCWES